MITFAIVQIDQAAFDDIKRQLSAAGYLIYPGTDASGTQTIALHGLAVQPRDFSAHPAAVKEAEPQGWRALGEETHAALCKAQMFKLATKWSVMLATHRASTDEAAGVPQWIDDPHDIEQGQMLNPEWLKLHGLTAQQVAAGGPTMTLSDAAKSFPNGPFHPPVIGTPVDARQEREALSEREFSEWLNANRNRDVSSIFHDTVAHYAAALSSTPATVPKGKRQQFSEAAMVDMLKDGTLPRPMVWMVNCAGEPHVPPKFFVNFMPYSSGFHTAVWEPLGPLLAATPNPPTATVQQDSAFESVTAKALERAWNDGWACCRDAEFIGEEAKNDAFNGSDTLARCLAADHGPATVQAGFVSTVDVEKLLCEKLGRKWSASGISIESLVSELATVPQEDEQRWSLWVAGMVGCYLGFGVDDERNTVIAGIIQRRIWGLPRRAAMGAHKGPKP